MICIYCGFDTEVYNSRPKAKQPLVWRRRQCKQCVAQFTTHELPDYATALVVKNGKIITPFERDKLFLSIHQACSHRPDSQASATLLTSTILGLISRKKLLPDGTIDNVVLARVTFTVLKRYDSGAAATYKAHHQKQLRQSNR